MNSNEDMLSGKVDTADDSFPDADPDATLFE